MDEEKIIEQKELEAIIELPRTLKLESGGEYTIYPLSVGKIALLADRFGELAPLIDVLANGQESGAGATIKIIKGSAMAVAECFYIVTRPNEEKEIIIDSEAVKKISFTLTMSDITEIVKSLKGALDISDLLKNVFSPISATKTLAEVGQR